MDFLDAAWSTSNEGLPGSSPSHRPKAPAIQRRHHVAAHGAAQFIRTSRHRAKAPDACSYRFAKGQDAPVIRPTRREDVGLIIERNPGESVGGGVDDRQP